MSTPTQPMPIDLVDGDSYARKAHAAFRSMREFARVYRDDKNRSWGIARRAHTQEVAKAPRLPCSGGGPPPDSPPIPSMITGIERLPVRWAPRT